LLGQDQGVFCPAFKIGPSRDVLVEREGDALPLFFFCGYIVQAVKDLVMARKMVKDRVKLGLIQMSTTTNPSANLSKAVERAEAAAKKGAQIVCLQELFRSRYFCQSEDQRNFKCAEAIPGPTTDVLGAVAREKEIVIVASLFERRSAGIYHNTAVIIDADGAIA